MSKSILEKILSKSINIDWLSRNLSESLSITFTTPLDHKRKGLVDVYNLTVKSLSEIQFLSSDLILYDSALEGYVISSLSIGKTLGLSADESGVKNLSYLDLLLKDFVYGNFKRVIGIGGGLIVNCSAYFAEKLNADLIHVPTSIIAMSDASIGGKVRVNDVDDGKFIKHAYKSFYEPSEIILDRSFLSHLNEEHIRFGLAEVIKHAFYQSPLLAQYLLSDYFDPFNDRESLLRAILWTADLKRICLEIDPAESAEGTYSILRAAHDISDKLEEQSKFKMSHGEAVERGMLEDLFKEKKKHQMLINLYSKLGINL